MASFLSHTDKGVYIDVVVIIRTIRSMSEAQAFNIPCHFICWLTLLLNFFGEVPFGKWKENRVIN